MTSWSIENLAKWKSGRWTRYQNIPRDVNLRIFTDQLFIYSGEQIVESINVQKIIKGFFKNGILIIVIGEIDNNVRKIKMKFSVAINLELCLNTLRSYFPIVDMDKTEMTFADTSTGMNTIPEKIREIFEDSSKRTPIKEHLKIFGSESEHLGNFIKCCILDPSFPDIVNMVEKEIDSLIKK